MKKEKLVSEPLSVRVDNLIKRNFSVTCYHGVPPLTCVLRNSDLLTFVLRCTYIHNWADAGLYPVPTFVLELVSYKKLKV